MGFHRAAISTCLSRSEVRRSGQHVVQYQDRNGGLFVSVYAVQYLANKILKPINSPAGNLKFLHFHSNLFLPVLPAHSHPITIPFLCPSRCLAHDRTYQTYDSLTGEPQTVHTRSHALVAASLLLTKDEVVYRSECCVKVWLLIRSLVKLRDNKKWW